MTGWLELPDILKDMWRLRRLPSERWFGILMGGVSIVAVTSDLATSSWVNKEWLPSRCDFKEGLIILREDSIYSSPLNEAASRTARNAQLNSYSNEGEIGIFYKSNTDTDFQATAKDIMGWWTCSRSKDSAVIPAEDYLSTIIGKLIGADFQYSRAPMGDHRNCNTDGNTKQVLFWSASAVNGSDVEIKASFDEGYSYTDLKIFSNYQCKLNASSLEHAQLQTVLGGINMTTTMYQWIEILPSFIYDGPDTPISQRPAFNLELVLNAIIMVQGGSGSILNAALPYKDQRYCCIAPQTVVSPFVILLTVAVALTLTGLLSWWIYLLLHLGENRSVLEPFPNNPLTWMLQSTREDTFMNSDNESRPLAPSKESDLEDWLFGAEGRDGSCLRVTRNEDVIPLTGMVSPGIGGRDVKTRSFGETMVEDSIGRISPYEGV